MARWRPTLSPSLATILGGSCQSIGTRNLGARDSRAISSLIYDRQRYDRKGLGHRQNNQDFIGLSALEQQDYGVMKKQQSTEPFNRREFLRGSSLASLMAMMGAVEIKAQEKKAEGSSEEESRPVGPPVNCAVIGCGFQGRDILSALSRLPNAPIVGVCDKYPAWMKRA